MGCGASKAGQDIEAPTPVVDSMGVPNKEKTNFRGSKASGAGPSQSHPDGSSQAGNEALPLDQDPEDEGLMRNNQTLGHDEDDVYLPSQSNPRQN